MGTVFPRVLWVSVSGGRRPDSVVSSTYRLLSSGHVGGSSR
jgi:hypothetical protein